LESIPSGMLESLVEPWYASLAEPLRSQQTTLLRLTQGYARTDYGKKFGAAAVESPRSYADSFPVANYNGLKPYFDEVNAGNESSLLPERVERWVMTRGTTGRPKLIPVTEAHLSLILSIGARAIVNFALKKRPSVIQRKVLNLNFPSAVGTIDSASGGGSYGYSSGTYAKLYPDLGRAALVPRQEEIDALGPGIGKADWEKRFELVYQRAREEDIGSTMGVTPVVLAFANYVGRKHGQKPSGLWNLDALFCTSVSKIHSKYSPRLKHHFGNVPVIEMYTATEGIFAQQIDDLPYVKPNYDAYFFEVKTSRGIKMLHEMARGEWGRLIVSTPILPRYDMGDLIEAEGKGYFRVIGRSRRTVVIEHHLYNLLTGRFL
jgi:hypothetical protein